MLHIDIQTQSLFELGLEFVGFQELGHSLSKCLDWTVVAVIISFHMCMVNQNWCCLTFLHRAEYLASESVALMGAVDGLLMKPMLHKEFVVKLSAPVLLLVLFRCMCM